MSNKISIRFPLGRDEDIFDDPAYRTGRHEVRAAKLSGISLHSPPST
jgi:hypothetical protein